MAVKQTIQTFLFKFSDGKTLKGLGDRAKQAGQNMGSFARSTYESDRRLKGLGQQSANASKNFSKQAQTIGGGLVPIYATLAAQIFAVSAAYRFLQDSFEVRNMIEGQKQFGAVTGVAYQTLTSQLQEATAGMLGFKEAASSLAIGIAAGLSGTQVTQLGEAAKNASLALGRDLTDSFNRLIRGVTKAEPELLDELGIILRLENATREYAQTIGKTKEQLNAYERTQAVMNNVMSQAEEKYGRIAEVMDPDSFALGQLTKEFDDLVRGFQVGMANTLLPLIGFLKDNVLALTAAIVLFARPIVGSMLPNLDAMGKSAHKNFEMASKAAKEATEEANIAATSALAAETDPKALKRTAGKGLKGLGVELKGKGKDAGMLSKAQIAAYKRAMDKKRGIYKKFNIEEKAAFRRHLLEMEQLHAASEGKQVEITTSSEYAKEAERAKSEAKQAGRAAKKAKWTENFAKGAQSLMTWIGYIGIALMAVQMIWNGIQWLRDLDEDAKKAREETEKLTEGLKTLNEELDRMTTIRGESILGGAESLEQVGNALQSIDIAKQMRDYNKEWEKGLTKDTREEYKKLADRIELLSPQMKELADQLRNGEEITDDNQKSYTRMTNAIIDASQASKMLEENTKSLNQALTKAIGKYGKLPYADLTKNLQSQLNILDRIIGGKAGDLDMYGTARIADTGLMGQKDERADQLRSIPSVAELQKLIDTSQEGDWVTHAMPYGRTTSTFIQTQEAAAATKELKRLSKIVGIGQDYLTDPTAWGKNLKKAKEQMEAWTIELTAATNARDHYTKLEKKVRNFVDEGLKLQTNMLKNEKDLVEIKLKGVGIESKLALNLEKIDKQKDKAHSKEVEHLAAIANLSQVMGGIEKQVLDEIERVKAENVKAGKEEALTEQQRLEISKMRGRLTEEEGEHRNVELVAAKRSITLTEEAWGIEQLREAVIENQVKAANNLLRIKRATLDVEREIWLMQRNQAIAQANESVYRPSSVAGKVTLRQSANARLIAMRDKKQTRSENMRKQMMKEFGLGSAYGETDIMQDYLEDGITKQRKVGVNAAWGGVDFSKPLEQSFFSDQEGELTEKQKAYNTALEKYLTLTKEIAVESAKVVAGDERTLTENRIRDVELQTDQMRMMREKVMTLNPIENEFQKMLLEHTKNGEKLNEGQLLRLRESAHEQANMRVEMELMNGLQSTLQSGFTNMFMALIDGSKSLKDSMKALFQQVLADMAAMYMRAAAMKMMMAFMPGGGSVMAFLGNPSGGRYGGQFSRSGKSFGYGGIAEGPGSGYQATLHGREAVVPLGNDRSIPVDIRGGGSNTVNVSINMQGGQSQTSTQGGGEQMQALGRQIGGLVQQHLQVEMRPGGLLNKMGSSGRQR